MRIRAVGVRGLIQKKLVLGSVLFGLVFVGLFALLVVAPHVGSEDSGSEFGYYGQYNRVKHVIESMPNIRIVARWQHRDLTLEDFGFTLLMDGTREVQVNASMHSPEWRTWRKSRLRELIQRQIDVNQPPEPWQKGLFPDSYYERSPELKAWRQRQPDPIVPKPMLRKRGLRPGESLPRPTNTNQAVSNP